MQLRRTSLQTLLELRDSAELRASRDLVESVRNLVISHVEFLGEHVAPQTVQDAYEHVVLLSERDNHVVGYCWGYYRRDWRSMEIFAGYVDAERRRQGLAMASFREMVNIGREAEKDKFIVRFASETDERTGAYNAIAAYARTLPVGFEIELWYRGQCSTIRGDLLTAPLTFIHETSPFAALQILQSRTFLIGGGYRDAVLNGELPDETFAQQAAATGAILTFEWTGPINDKRPDFYDPNILYDERPNRIHVFHGTDRYLRLAGIELRDGMTWAEVLPPPKRPTGWAWLDLQTWRDRLRPKKALVRRTLALAEEVRRCVAEKPSITVQAPDDYPMYLLNRGRRVAEQAGQAETNP